MINNSPFWKRPVWMLVFVALAIGGGLWLAMDRPLPARWSETDAWSEIPIPEGLRRSQPDRLFCAESSETGVCRCITAGGQRPEVSDAECRRRASAGDTSPLRQP